MSSWDVLSTKVSLPHCSALQARPELGPLGAMAPLLDACTAHLGASSARIEKRRVGLFVAAEQDVGLAHVLLSSTLRTGRSARPYRVVVSMW